MIEALVRCTCASYILSDISITLKKDREYWLTKKQVDSSAELRIAVRSGAVQVQWRERCSVIRSPVPPFTNRLIQKSGRLVKPDIVNPSDTVTAQEIREMVRDVVREELLRVSDASEQRLLDAIRVSLRDSPRAPSRGVTFDDPIFIPSDLVPKGEATFSVASESSASGNLNDAAEALKVVRRKKKEAS